MYPQITRKSKNQKQYFHNTDYGHPSCGMYNSNVVLQKKNYHKYSKKWWIPVLLHKISLRFIWRIALVLSFCFEIEIMF